MADPYYNYRPMLDLLGISEGTDPTPAKPNRRGYNETLSYGAYTGGDVDLVSMTLHQVDGLQSQMLAHPKNKWNSSAAGRYQIVRKTRRSIEESLGISRSELFDETMQDRMACYLLGFRGIDKWLDGNMGLETIVDNLAKEWASLPVYKTGKSYYGNQNASVSVTQVTNALDQVRERHEGVKPAPEPPTPTPEPTPGFDWRPFIIEQLRLVADNLEATMKDDPG